MLNLGRARARADYRGRAALMATTFLTSLAGALPAYAATIEVNNTQSYPADGALGSTGSDRVHVGATSEGDLTISGGVDVESSHLMIDTGTATGESSVTLSGAGTTWNLSPTLDRLLEIGAGGDGSGALIIENGASLQVNGLGFSAIGNGSDGRVVIDGAGSLFDAGTPLDIGRDGVSESTVTVSNGGTLKLGGNIRLGDSAGNTARVNIGAASGQAAVAAGIMDVGGITGSLGSGDVVVFNHTDTGYVFTTSLGLNLDLFLENGVTELANAANSYTGETVLTGGTLRLADGGALGATSRVRMDGGRLELTGTSTFSAAGRLDSDTEFDVSAGETATWSGALSGANGVRKTGTGTLVLTGANSYSGDTRVDQGILAATSNGALGSLGSVLIMDGGGFRFDADFAVDRTVNLDAAANTFDTNGFDGEISGTMSGTGALAKTGAGELYLNGTHSFSGGAILQGGSLKLSGDSALGSGTLTFDGGMLDASNNIFWVDNDVVIGAGGGSVDTGFLGLTFEGDISGTGTLTKIGFGTLELTGNNTFTGTYRIDSGNLAVSTATLSGADVINNSRMTLDDGADATYAGDMSGTGVLRKTGSGVVTLTGTNTYSGGTDIYDDGGLRGTSTSLTGDFNIADANATLEFDQAANATFAGDVSGAGSFIKSGAGTLTLTGAFTHTGGIAIQAGGLTGTSNVFSGDIANNGTLTFDQGFDGAYAGNVSGTGDFVKAGAGNLTLTGTLGHTGATTVQAGGLTGTSNVFSGDIVNNGALIFDQAFDGTFAHDVSGTGGLGKTGTGTVTLTGTLTYTGSTIIQAGGLTGTSSIFPGDITNNGTLTFDQGFDDTFADDVSGTGGFVKAGTGTVTLTGTFGHTGGTTIQAGGLTGTSNALSGDVVNNGTLTFDQAFDGTFAGDVSGVGQFIKSGAGTLTLTGAHTHTGGTTIQAGGLTGTSNVFSGDIANNGALTFDQAFDGTYAGNVSGTGGFVKVGTGNLTLTGTHSGAGGTTVQAGGLTVNGTMSGGPLTVQSGARLQGTGTLPGTNLMGGAAHAPGNSIGTQTIIGDYDLGAGASLEIETHPSGASDKLVVQGGVTLGGNLQVQPQAGPYEDVDYSYVIIDNDAADAVTGTFGTLTNPLAFYDASVGYAAGDGNDVELKLTRNAAGFPDVAETFNEKSVSKTVRSLTGADGTAVKGRVLGATAAQARALYNSLSGEIFAAMPSMLGDVTRQLRSVLFDRMSLLQGLGGLRQGRQDEAGLTLSGAKLAGFAPLSGAMASDAAYLTHRHGRAADSANASVMPRLGMAPGGLNAANSGVWMQMMGGDTERDGDGNAAPVDVQWRGGIGGADMALTPDFRAGAYGGYAQLDGTQDLRAARAEADTLIAGIYGSYAPGAWRLSATAGYAEYDTESTREITLGTPQIAKASYTDREWTASIETAYRIDMSGALGVTSSLEPYLGIDGGYTDLGSFTESGAGGANLTRESEDYWQGRAFTGLRAAALFEGENGQSLVPSLRLGVWQRLGQTRDEMQLRMSAASSSFTVRAREEAEQGVELGGGLAFLHESGVSAFVDYGAELASGEDTQTLSFGVRWAF